MRFAWSEQGISGLVKAGLNLLTITFYTQIMKKILVPTDFSKEAQNALDLASQFAVKFKMEIILLHVLEVPYGSYSVMGEVGTAASYAYENLYESQLIKKTTERLQEMTADLKSQKITAEFKLVFGIPFSHIQETITSQHVDMVILGSKGASGLAEIFIGSNAEKVIRHAVCPVITVKGPVELSKMKSIVFATDTSPAQDAVAAEVKKLQKMLHLNVHLVRVCTPRNYLTHDVAIKQLEDFAERNAFENYTTGSINAHFTDEGINEYAVNNNAGIIAIGTHGRTGLAHFFGGSIAEDVANHSIIPIWTIKMKE